MLVALGGGAPLPLGVPPDGTGAHAIVVSLPTLRDVIGYETGEERVKSALRTGYPRFVEHASLKSLQRTLGERFADALCARGAPAGALFLAIADPRGAVAMLQFCAAMARAHGDGVDRTVAEGAAGRSSAVLLGERLLRDAASVQDVAREGGWEAAVSSAGGVTLGELEGGGGGASDWLGSVLRAQSASAAVQGAGEGAGARAGVSVTSSGGHGVAAGAGRSGDSGGDLSAAAAFERDSPARHDDADRLWCVLAIPREWAPFAGTLQQHIGARISSRLAEAVLARVRGADGARAESPAESPPAALAAAHASLRETAARWVGLPRADAAAALHITSSGAAAFSSALCAVQAVAAARAVGGGGSVAGEGAAAWPCPAHPAGRLRDTWLQIGWLYVDTTRALEKCAAPACASCDAAEASSSAPVTALADPPPPGCTRSPGLVAIRRVDDAAGLAWALQAVGRRLAGAVTEAPTNPLVASVDTAALRAALNAAGAADAVLIVDPTLAGPGAGAQGRGVLSAAPESGAAGGDTFCGADVAILSLTKYVGSHANALGGAVVVRAGGVHAHELVAALLPLPPARGRDGARARVSAHVSPFLLAGPPPPICSRTALALGALAPRAISLARRVSLRARAVGLWGDALVRATAGGGGLRAVHWARGAPVGGCGAIVTLEVTGTWPLDAAFTPARAEAAVARAYDAFRGVKGPSFGAAFSILCPYLFLAHFDDVTTDAGRAALVAAGLNPYLLRLSCGCERARDIIGALVDALGVRGEDAAAAAADADVVRALADADAVEVEEVEAEAD